MHLLIDGNTPIELPGNYFSQETIIKGDSIVEVISAASILAKVTRDRVMSILDKRFPDYGFEKHKGYPTKFHREQIARLGPTLHHRQTFAGVREFTAAAAAHV